MSLSLAEHLAALEHEGALFAAAIQRAEPDTAIPTCPGWTMRDLALHLGTVHRWVLAKLSAGLATPRQRSDDEGSPPSDDALADWLLEGHRELLNTLRAADPDLKYFTFLADPLPPLHFWARRQAHETGMHRVDAESASGAVTPFGTPFAADGIDEMLTGFAPRPHMPLHAEKPVTLHVIVDDAPYGWRMSISEGPPRTERTDSTAADADADCTVSGTSNDVYQALWNRVGTETLQISGDRAVLDLFRENVKIQWV